MAAFLSLTAHLSWFMTYTCFCTNTRLHKHIISWHAGSRSGVVVQPERMHSISSGSSWLAGWQGWIGQTEDKVAFIFWKPTAGILKIKEKIKIKKGNKEWCSQLCSFLQWKCHHHPPCICVRHRASHIKTLQPCLIICELLERDNGAMVTITSMPLCSSRQKIRQSGCYLQP